MLPKRLLSEARGMAKRDLTVFEQKRLIKLYLMLNNIICPVDKIHEDSIYFKQALEKAKETFSSDY